MRHQHCFMVWLQLTNIPLLNILRGRAVSPVCGLSIPTLIISDCEVWIYAPLGHHGEVEMVSFKRLVWIKSAEQLNYLRDKRKKRNNDKMCQIYAQPKPQMTDFTCRVCTDSSWLCFCCSLPVVCLFVCLAALKIDMKWPSQRDADTFLKNLYTWSGRASSNWLTVNQKHQSAISHTHTSPACVPSQIYGR